MSWGANPSRFTDVWSWDEVFSLTHNKAPPLICLERYAEVKQTSNNKTLKYIFCSKCPVPISHTWLKRKGSLYENSLGHMTNFTVFFPSSKLFQLFPSLKAPLNKFNNTDHSDSPTALLTNLTSMAISLTGLCLWGRLTKTTKTFF